MSEEILNSELETKELTRFDLEDAIMCSWSTSSDLELLNSYDKDLVEAVITLHNYRMNKLFDIFSELLKNGTIN